MSKFSCSSCQALCPGVASYCHNCAHTMALYTKLADIFEAEHRPVITMREPIAVYKVHYTYPGDLESTLNELVSEDYAIQNIFFLSADDAQTNRYQVVGVRYE